MKVELLANDERNAIGRIRFVNNQEAVFRVTENGTVVCSVEDGPECWAGDSPEAFRQIALAWNVYCEETGSIATEEEHQDHLQELRRKLSSLDALRPRTSRGKSDNWWFVLLESEF